MDGIQNFLSLDSSIHAKAGRNFFHLCWRRVCRHIQKIKLEDNNLHIGRFLIAPHKQGQGLGRKAFQDFIQEMFENEEIESISLTVFESNPIAKKLYQKEGFDVVQTIEYPERKFIMKKVR